MPDHDYIPLFALLGRHLSDAEVQEIAQQLASSGDAHSKDAIHAAINAVMKISRWTPMSTGCARTWQRAAGRSPGRGLADSPVARVRDYRGASRKDAYRRSS